MEDITKSGGVDASTRGNLKQHEEVRSLVAEVMKGVHKFESYEAIVNFAQQLRKKHPDWNKYQLFHIMVMSTPDYTLSTIADDFEGEDSIVNFLKSLRVKYQVNPETLGKTGQA